MLVKPAETAYAVHELIRSRWSPRAFANRPVDTQTLGSLMEAARWAPSSYNEQPWRFIIATQDDPAEFDKLLGCLVEFNQGWAKAAPVLMLSVASLHFAKNGKPNPHAWHDVGLASENLVIQATSMGLVCHGMAGYNASKARATYGIPEGFDVVAAWAIGYQGDPDSLPEQMRDSEREPRKRKPLSEMVFSGRWEQPAPLIENE